MDALLWLGKFEMYILKIGKAEASGGGKKV